LLFLAKAKKGKQLDGIIKSKRYRTMIRFILLFALITWSLAVNAQTLEESLASYLPTYHAADNAEHWHTQIERFAELRRIHDDRWLPMYYEGLARFNVSYELHNAGYGKQRDAQLDTAQALVNKALEIGGDTTELYVLQGLIYQGRIWKNPMMYGGKYSNKSIHILKKAIARDAQNPRAPHMIGQLQYHLPAFMGGGAEAAMPMLERAEALYAGFEPAGPYAPTWGSQDLKGLLHEIRQASDH
jgi:hypothetical protein